MIAKIAQELERTDRRLESIRSRQTALKQDRHQNTDNSRTPWKASKIRLFHTADAEDDPYNGYYQDNYIDDTHDIESALTLRVIETQHIIESQRIPESQRIVPLPTTCSKPNCTDAFPIPKGGP
jgi:hypothetical protein